MPPSGFTEVDHICVVQLTDCHLFGDSHARLLGLDTRASLDAVVERVLAEHRRIDLVLATGDITQDGSEEGYRCFIETARRLAAPCYWIPGNHDDAALMERIGRPAGLSADWVDLGKWRIVLLDSSLDGSVAGHLGDAQFDRLDAALSTAGGRHVMLCLHHHPVPIGSDWMEPLGLRDAQRFMSRVDASGDVRAVLWGHIHQQLDQLRGDVRLLASPSTCVQFAENSSGFATDSQAPGYRWLKLFANGRIDTGVRRLAAGRFLPEEGASGY